MRIGDLAGSAAVVNGKFWRATVVITVTDPAGVPVAGASVSAGWTVGASDTCLTGASGTCSVVSDNLRRNSAASVTLTVAGATHATYVYDAAANLETSIVVARP
jgi:hypothetical protein